MKKIYSFWLKKQSIDKYEKIPCNNARLNRVMSHVFKENAEQFRKGIEDGLKAATKSNAYAIGLQLKVFPAATEQKSPEPYL